MRPNKTPWRLACCLMACWAIVGNAQVSPLFQNFGTMVNPAPINALRVENYGSLVDNAFSTAVWDFQNMKEFQNFSSGFIDIGNGGIVFDQLDLVNNPTGIRTALGSFENTGRIYSEGELTVNSTNIAVNFSGLLSAGQNGVLRMSGDSIDLTNGRIRGGMGSEVSPYVEGFITFQDGYYVNPKNIRDHAWGVNTNNTFAQLNLSGIAGSAGSGFSPSHRVLRSAGPGGALVDISSLNLDQFNFYMNNTYERVPNNGPVRAVVQMVFIETNVADMADIAVSFAGRTNSNLFEPQTVTVQFSVTDRDPLTGQQFSRNITLVDRSAIAARPAPGGFTAPRMFELDQFGLFRPETFSVFRDVTAIPTSLREPAQTYQSSFMFTTDAMVNGRYSARAVDYGSSAIEFSINPYNYSGAGAGNFFSDPTDLDRSTNSEGRVEIIANNLNLAGARVRADNLIKIQATNIANLSDSILQAPNIMLESRGTTGTVTITNTFPSSVARMHGLVEAQSYSWRVDQFITNAVPANYDIAREPFEGDTINWAGTNTVEYLYQVLIIDHTVTTNMPVEFASFNVASEGLVLGNHAVFNNKFLFQGESLTLTTNFQFTGDLQTFNRSNAPALLNFTNLGNFVIPAQANFGFDGAAYSNIVNRGNIIAGDFINPGSALFRSDYFENSSTVSVFNGSIFVSSLTNRLFGGTLTADANLDLSGKDLVATNVALVSGGLTSFNITERLTDGGITNTWVTSGGFRMLSKPKKGDLLATEIVTQADAFTSTLLSWAGEDRGDNPAGYANNAAVARLVLDGDTNANFRFLSSGLSSAMYVDVLQLRNSATNFNNISFDSNFKLYFNVLIDENGETNVLSAEKFTNSFGGQAVWVSENTFNGPMVQVPLGIAGVTNMTTSAFRSLLPAYGDYDNDGLINEVDTMPLSGFTITGVSLAEIANPPGSAPRPHSRISWQALPNTTYHVEYRNSVNPEVWKTLSVRIASEGGELVEYDPVPVTGQRYYRVRYQR